MQSPFRSIIAALGLMTSLADVPGAHPGHPSIARLAALDSVAFVPLAPGVRAAGLFASGPSDALCRVRRRVNATTVSDLLAKGGHLFRDAEELTFGVGCISGELIGGRFRMSGARSARDRAAMLAGVAVFAARRERLLLRGATGACFLVWFSSATSWCGRAGEQPAGGRARRSSGWQQDASAVE